MTQGILLVLANVTDGRHDEFNTWYDKVHLDDVIAVPGVTGARRYELSELEVGKGGLLEGWDYLAVYDLSCNTDADFEAIAEAFRGIFMSATGEIDSTKQGAGSISDTLDLTTVKVVFSRLITDRTAGAGEQS